jgi:hypothetical protein
MSNIDAVNALITAINFDRFPEIEARHNPDVVFTSFRGPTLHSSVAVEDWHTTFLRDYADCNYADLEYVEKGESVAVRATLEAKGYDWRPFTQRVLEVFDFDHGGVSERRMYGMLQDLELDKPSTAALTNALEYKGGSAGDTQKILDGFSAAVLAGDTETAASFLADKVTLIDTIYGIVNGPTAVLEVLASIPRPLFGTYRVTRTLAGAKDGVVETSIDANRPRKADWLRIVDGKILVIESYWMFREIGFKPETHDRHVKQVILPI